MLSVIIALGCWEQKRSPRSGSLNHQPRTRSHHVALIVLQMTALKDLVLLSVPAARQTHRRGFICSPAQSTSSRKGRGLLFNRKVPPSRGALIFQPRCCSGTSHVRFRFYSVFHQMCSAAPEKSKPKRDEISDPLISIFRGTAEYVPPVFLFLVSSSRDQISFDSIQTLIPHQTL